MKKKSKAQMYKIRLSFSEDCTEEIFKLIADELFRIYVLNNLDEGIVWVMDVCLCYFLKSIVETKYTWKEIK